MRKTFAIAVAIVAALSMTACSQEAQQVSEAPGAESAQKAVETVSLDGTWREASSSGQYQEAVVEGNSIVIFWVGADGARSVYWQGTAPDPTETEGHFAWTSVSTLDTSRSTGHAYLMASTDSEKRIEYDHGQLSYEVSALGTTKTVRLDRAS